MNNDDFKDLYNKYAVFKDGKVRLCATLEETREITGMTDYERVLLAMKTVNKHKLKSIVKIEELQLLAEAAVKMMYLIDLEREKP